MTDELRRYQHVAADLHRERDDQGQSGNGKQDDDHPDGARSLDVVHDRDRVFFSLTKHGCCQEDHTDQYEDYAE